MAVMMVKRGGQPATPRQRNYRYTLHLAIGLCEGPVSHLVAFGPMQLLPPDRLAMNLHKGEPDAAPDPIIEQAMGRGQPTFRGMAYVVLRDFDVTSSAIRAATRL